MRGFVKAVLLGALNSRLLNATPCKYGFINGLDAVSYEELENEDRQYPGITVREVLKSIDRFRSCQKRTGLTVIEGDVVRDADLWDVHALSTTLKSDSTCRTPHQYPKSDKLTSCPTDSD